MPPDSKRLSLVPLILVWVSAAGFQDVDQSLPDLALAGRAEAVRSLLAGTAPNLDAADETIEVRPIREQLPIRRDERERQDCH